MDKYICVNLQCPVIFYLYGYKIYFKNGDNNDAKKSPPRQKYC